MNEPLHRRDFLGSSAAGLVLGLSSNMVFADPVKTSDKLVVGVMGTGGRGTALAKLFASQPGVTVAYTCDVDKKRAEGASAEVSKATKEQQQPKAIQDFREVLKDESVNIMVIATCNHWHAPGAILACAHGKHVYVEKPCSHNPWEGEMMVQAARKHKKFVQMGNQRRSWDKIIEAINLVRSGEAIGRAYLAQSWYTNTRPTIGVAKEAPIPEGLLYDLWEGPAPHRAFKTNFLHYNWHWFWNWGNGELGNNGVHMIDLCRWGLGVDYPINVTSSGGRYRYEDDQETPDTHLVSFDFEGRKTITWQGTSCNQLPPGNPLDVLFTGEKGCLAIHGSGYTIFDVKGKEVKKVTGTSSDASHVANFLDAVRSGKPLNSEIEEAHKSTLLCHLGNIAHRVGRSLKCNPKDGHILSDKQAAELWRREYNKEWEPKV